MKTIIIHGQNHMGSTYHIAHMLADKVGGMRIHSRRCRNKKHEQRHLFRKRLDGIKRIQTIGRNVAGQEQNIHGNNHK